MQLYIKGVKILTGLKKRCKACKQVIARGLGFFEKNPYNCKKMGVRLGSIAITRVQGFPYTLTPFFNFFICF
jgi:hypothetical protein